MTFLLYWLVDSLSMLEARDYLLSEDTPVELKEIIAIRHQLKMEAGK